MGPTRRLRLIALIAANVLFGMALGVLGHYALTDVVHAAGQSSLATQLAEVELPDSAAGSTAATSPPRIDLGAWETEDATYWRDMREGGPFARLVIARMGLDCVVVKGSSPKDLKLGPGWISGTDPPGATGNTGIAGHRTTYGSPFGRIDELVEGDRIALYSPYRRYLYEVTESLVVAPDEVDVIASTKAPTLTLTACHPRFSARRRYVVHARLVEVRRLEAAGAR